MSNGKAKQNWKLKDLLDTDYGVVDPNGLYDVDDEAGMTYKTKFCEYNLLANWRTDLYDDIGINFEILGNVERVELGLCPEDAYKRMIDTGSKNRIMIHIGKINLKKIFGYTNKWKNYVSKTITYNWYRQLC